MGFGTKTDPQTGRTINLDKSYRGVIKPAVEDAGLTCARADEIVHSGSIELSMYEQLLGADVVVADISTCNPNAMYELGVRHALRPFTTVVIAEDKITYPFDVAHIVIRKYQHLGPAIDVEEAERFRAELAGAIMQLVGRPEPDSPVYTILARLQPPFLEMLTGPAGAPSTVPGAPPSPVPPSAAAAAAPIAAGPSAPAAPAPAGPPPAEASPAPASIPAPAPDQTLSELTQQAEAAFDDARFTDAKALFAAARALRPTDAYLTQRLALATYKTASPTVLAALDEAKAILQELDPEVSNDPETLGLWGSIHKHLWDETCDRADLDTAILAHERGFDIRNDAYNGINLAYLLNVRARISSPAEQIADYVNAQRVRRRVIDVCQSRLSAGVSDPDERYWAKATLVEACIGVGDITQAEEWHRQAEAEPVAGWMKESTRAQLTRLRDLLLPSPLEGIQAAAAG